jgi:hypothetical protein
VYTLGRQRRTSSSQQGAFDPVTVQSPAPTPEERPVIAPEVVQEVVLELSTPTVTPESNAEEHPPEVVEEAQQVIERVEAGERLITDTSPTHTPSKISRIVPVIALHTDHVYNRQDTNFSPNSARRSLQMLPDAAAPTILPTGSKRNL